MFFNGGDSETIALRDEAHEEIIAVALAGTGSIKSLKNVTSGCGYCGEDLSVTEYCNILWAMNGSVTGVMDCQCPDDEDWWHTVETVRCGVYYADIDATKMSEVTSPSHYASFYGTWTAKFNKKLSDTKVK